MESDRIRALEAEIRALRQQVESLRDVVITKRLEVLSERGDRIRASLACGDGMVDFHLLGANGEIRMEIGLSDDDSPSINLFDAQHKYRLGLAVVQEDGTAFVTVRDSAERPRAQLTVNDGQQCLHLLDRNGNPAAMLCVGNDGDTLLDVHCHRRARISLRAEADGRCEMSMWKEAEGRMEQTLRVVSTPDGARVALLAEGTERVVLSADGDPPAITLQDSGKTKVGLHITEQGRGAIYTTD